MSPTEVKFTVKEGADGQVFLFSDPMRAANSSAVHIWLKSGTTLAQAEKLANEINLYASGVSTE